jgi:hypothetical protein
MTKETFPIAGLVLEINYLEVVKMEEIKEVRLIPTKACNGFKIVMGEKWLYTSKKALYEMLDGVSTTVSFREIENADE